MVPIHRLHGLTISVARSTFPSQNVQKSFLVFLLQCLSWSCPIPGNCPNQVEPCRLPQPIPKSMDWQSASSRAAAGTAEPTVDIFLCKYNICGCIYQVPLPIYKMVFHIFYKMEVPDTGIWSCSHIKLCWVFINRSFSTKHHRGPKAYHSIGKWSLDHFWKLWCRKSAHFFLARSTFCTPGSDHFWKFEKVHTVVARSTFPCEHTMFGPRMSKKCTPLWRAHFQAQNVQSNQVVEMSKKWTQSWREAHFQVKMYKTHQLRSEHFLKLTCRKIARRWGRKRISSPKMLRTPHARTDFESSDVVFRGRHKGFCTLPKVSKTWGLCGISKNYDGRHGTFEEDLERCIFRGMRSTKDMFIRDVRRSGRWFLERGCILEHQVFRFAKMILHDRCSTSYDLALLLLQAQHFTQMERKNRKTHWYEAVSSALNFPFLKEVSQNCYDFDVVKFENWGRLAELLRFQACR